MNFVKNESVNFSVVFIISAWDYNQQFRLFKVMDSAEEQLHYNNY